MRLDLRQIGPSGVIAGALTIALALGMPAPGLAQIQAPAPPPPTPAPTAAVGSVTIGSVTTSSAASIETKGRQSYAPEYFSGFGPRSAYDMLDKVPGFSIQEADEARGLGQASGNVLINGARFSGKSDSAKDQLSRINASDVVRIEIVDGATLDMPGLTGQVANVVVRQSGFSGQFVYEPKMGNAARKSLWTKGEISINASVGPADITLAFDNDAHRGGSIGPALITAGDDALIDDRILSTNASRDRPKFSGSVRLELASDVIANVNALHTTNTFRWRRREERFPAGEDPSLRFLQRNDNYKEYEIGADIQFPLGPGKLKLIGLEAFKRQDFSTQGIIELVEGTADSGVRSTLHAETGERIGRMEYSWPMLGGDWQLSGEAAFNRRDNDARLFSLNAAGDFQENAFPAGKGRVTEARYEGILSYGRPLTDTLSMQLAVGGEYSRLKQTGFQAEEREFRRPKGSVSLAWAAASGLDISVRLNRSVGQLDFGDFLGLVRVDDDNQSAGNNQLVPQQSWEAELEITKDLGAWGSTRLKAERHWIEDVVTYILVPGGGESLGNVDRADRKILTLDSTLNLGAFGFSGARLDVLLKLEDSSIADPLTGIMRQLDEVNGFSIKHDFRHDIPGSDLAWGFELDLLKLGRYYRVFESGSDDGFRKWGQVYVEHKDLFGLTVRASYGNLFNESSITDRTFYDGPRHIAPVLYNEISRRNLHRFIEFSIRGSF